MVISKQVLLPFKEYFFNEINNYQETTHILLDQEVTLHSVNIS
jgi:hypothetical protein